MCGIVGYVGPQQALDVVIEGLRRLEYRGYDSAGVAVVADGHLTVTVNGYAMSEVSKTTAVALVTVPANDALTLLESIAGV